MAGVKSRTKRETKSRTSSINQNSLLTMWNTKKDTESSDCDPSKATPQPSRLDNDTSPSDNVTTDSPQDVPNITTLLLGSTTQNAVANVFDESADSTSQEWSLTVTQDNSGDAESRNEMVASSSRMATKVKVRYKISSRNPSRKLNESEAVGSASSRPSTNRLTTTSGTTEDTQDSSHLSHSPAPTAHEYQVIDVDLGDVTVPQTHDLKGTEYQPIVVDSSPVKARPKPSPSSTSFFAPRKLKVSQDTIQTRKRKIGEGSLPQWPSGDLQHVGLSSCVFQPASTEFSRRNVTACNAAGPSAPLPCSLQPFLPRTSPTPIFSTTASVSSVSRIISREDIKSRLNASICGISDQSAVLSRFSHVNDWRIDLGETSAANQEPWTEKWHPRQAVEVLTNEPAATFLRDWLRALAVRITPHGDNLERHVVEGGGEALNTKNSRAKRKGKAKVSAPNLGLKRRNIVREVDKSRRRKRRRVDSDEESIDDWMVEDEMPEEEDQYNEEEDVFLQDLFGLIASNADVEADDSSPCGSPWKPRLTRLSRKRPPDCEPEAILEDESNVQVIQDEAGPSTIPIETYSRPTHDFSSLLTNSILLTGPPGSGKTAAVYACAEELGWEVFEVYPGIGKRNGASLASLVGDVGKNHVVAGKTSTSIAGRSGPQREREKTSSQQKQLGFDSLFSSKTKLSDVVHTDCRGEDAESRHTLPLDGGFGFLTSGPNDLDDQAYPSARQSIILLEEVDILYGEDTGFWPMVVNLIKDSRRPVIMTCNDIGLIPIRDLPLQTTLFFEACAEDAAIAYLDCVALSEGYAVTRDLLADIHKPLHLPLTTDASDDLLMSKYDTNLSVADIRRSINQLQYLCQGCGGDSVSDGVGVKEQSDNFNPSHDSEEVQSLDQLQDWECAALRFQTDGVSEEDSGPARAHTSLLLDLTRMSDALSAADSYVRRRDESSLEAFTAEGGSSLDAEVGHRQLTYETDHLHLQGGIPLYNYDERMAVEIARCAKEATRRGGRGTIRLNRTGGRRTSDLLQRRSVYFSGASDLVGRVLQDSKSVSRGAMVLDYTSWVRNMIDADDLLEAADARQSQEARAAGRGGRMTRNSQRESYVRYITLSDEQRRLVRDTAFRVDDTLLEDDRRGTSNGGARQRQGEHRQPRQDQ